MRRASPGFTLMEVLVALIIASLVVGAVMSLTSGELTFASRVKRKVSAMRVLDAAGQFLLTHPNFLREKPETMTLSDLPGQPVVKVEMAAVEQTESGDLKLAGGALLYRVGLSHGGASSWLSLIVPGKDQK
jgi:prepilin-type N-terminal cleavage/methylation domain-containing protein